MEKSEEEKLGGGSEDSQGSLGSVNQEYALLDPKKMNPEEMKSYLDELFRSSIFSEG